LPELFERSVSAAIPRVADRAGHNADSALISALFSLRQVATPLLVENYVVAYEADPVNFYLGMDSSTTSFYSQIHSTLAIAAALVAARASPAFEGVAGLAALEQHAARDQSHPLAAELRRRRREVGLLRWLARVRNKVVQHRVENDSMRASVVLDANGLAIVRTHTAPDAAQVRKARGLVAGFNRKYGNQVETDGTHEPFARLAIASHFLHEWGEFGEFDAARAVAEEAHLFHLTVTPPLIRNADAAMASLIEAAPNDPEAPFGGRASGR